MGVRKHSEEFKHQVIVVLLGESIILALQW